MSRIPNLGDLLRKRLDRVRRHEPARLDLVFLPQVQESVYTDRGTEDAPRDIGPACWSPSLGVDPAFINHSGEF